MERRKIRKGGNTFTRWMVIHVLFNNEKLEKFTKRSAGQIVMYKLNKKKQFYLSPLITDKIKNSTYMESYLTFYFL